MADKHEEDQEPRVRVVDKRRIHMNVESDGPAPEAPPAVAAAPSEEALSEPPSATEPTEESAPRDLPLIGVADLMRIFVAELHTRAWIHLGLMANPQTNLLVKDLSEARLAIDCIAALVEKLLPITPAAEREELKRMLTDLRLNYVQQSS